MKKRFVLDCTQEYSFIVLAINSHKKGHILCWHLNKQLNLNLEMKHPHRVDKKKEFTRYEAKKEGKMKVNFLYNRSKAGYLIPSHKSVNYFLVISKEDWASVKHYFLNKVKQIKDVLLAFQLDLDNTKNSDRFIIYDKKN